MEDSFYQAHVHSGPYVVLKRRLHPLCLYDILLLMLAKSPYGDIKSNSGKSFRVSMQDLQVAVMICSTPLDSFVGETNHYHLWPAVKLLIWKYRIRNLKLKTEAKIFDNYFNDYFSAPELWDGDGEGSPIGAPWPLAIVASLMKNTAMTRFEAWTMPLGEAIWLNAALLEQSGSAEIASVEQLEALYELGLRERPSSKGVSRA